MPTFEHHQHHLLPLQVLRDRVPAFECLAVDALTSELDFSHRLDEFNDASLPPGAKGATAVTAQLE